MLLLSATIRKPVQNCQKVTAHAIYQRILFLCCCVVCKRVIRAESFNMQSPFCKLHLITNFQLPHYWFKRSCTISVNDRSLHDGFSLFLPYLSMLTIYKGGHATVDLLLEVSLPPKAVIALMRVSVSTAKINCLTFSCTVI